MNNLSFIKSDGYHEITTPKSDISAPCNSRCRSCSLFPFEKLKKSNINKGDDFGTFIIHGERRKISSQGIRLICALTHQENRIIPKDYLIKYVWPDLPIARNNLNVAIYELRILLRGSSVNIENHRKEGYSLTR